ncbi:hypothetical protein ACIP5Y_44915 [Nocardia sp. NPDC088792]|uniref:hypothetical protein n=1 Tax=Nocardia sp. NPDC088792 TaxID=3364332 RepID=UPI00382E5D02
MTYPPHGPNPGASGPQGPPPPGYGAPPPQYSSQPQAPQGFSPQQPQPYQSQPYPPQQGFAPQGGPGFLPGAPVQGYPQQGGYPQPGDMPPQGPGGPGQQRPVWKSPIVLGAGAVVLVLVIVLGIVLATRGGDSKNSSASAPTTTPSAATSTRASATTSSAKATTTTKAPAAVPADLQPTVDALPAALRKSVLKRDIRDRPGDATLNGGYDAKAQFTLNAHDPLLQGLMHYPDNDYFPEAYLVKDPAQLEHIWQTVDPQMTTDEGARVVHIDPGNQYSENTATLEIFVPASNLYFEINQFQSVDAVRQFMQRAGF